MNQESKNKILEYHSKGLTLYFISARLKIPKEDVKQVIESSIRKDFRSLF